MIFFGLCLVFSFATFAQDVEMDLWENEPPGSILNEDYIEENSFDGDVVTGASKVKKPKIYAFFPEGNASKSAVIIFPGGGYSHLAINKEGFKAAKWLNSQGITAFVLKYRLPDDRIMENKSVAPLQDAQRAIRLVREHAEKWNIDSTKVGIMGFSAGGHLASTISTHFDEVVYPNHSGISARPDFSILIYPVVSLEDSITHQGSRKRLLGDNPSNDLITHFSNETQVTQKTPPAFLVHAVDDKSVPIENSLKYMQSLSEANIPVESHFFEKGGHGFGLGGHLESAGSWPELLLKWMALHDYR